MEDMEKIRTLEMWKKIKKVIMSLATLIIHLTYLARNPEEYWKKMRQYGLH
jgi:hypothetical protein